MTAWSRRFANHVGIDELAALRSAMAADALLAEIKRRGLDA